MKFKIKKFLLVSVLISIILFSICPKAFATNGNEMSISSKDGIGNTVEIISGNTNSIRSESVADVVSYLTGQNITVNSITNHKGASVELTSTALIGTGYVLDTSNGNYTVIVYGDANGDGEADAGDMKIIIDNFLGIKQASLIAKIAVDLYQDGDLDAADLKQVLDGFLGNLTGSILKTTSTSNPTPTPTQVSFGPQIKVGGETIALTPENAPDYYGQVVTNYSAVNSATWRLFYVDFDGKYGEAGKIYLKADCGDLDGVINKTISVNSTSALEKMKEMNPEWNINDGIIDLNNEMGTLWLCDETQWSNYKNVNKADSVIGAPSVEMWADSYNQYHSKNQTAGYQKIKYKWYDMTSSGKSKGYMYAIGVNSDNYDYRTSMNSLVLDENNMYIKPEAYYNFWLASPSIYAYSSTDNCLSCVSWNKSLFSNSCIDKAYFCPVISLKNEMIPEVSNEIVPSGSVQVKIENQIILLTPENASEYYGKIVTNYSASATATWRLFYVDFAGKYGNKGKVYLKADAIKNRTLNDDESNNTVDALNLMKAMNPEWATWDGNADENNEKAVLYLCNETQWSNYKNVNKADNVMGSPSVEMWVDSYNQYHSKKRTNGYKLIKCAWNSLLTLGQGYRYSVENGEYNYETEVNVLVDNPDMYVKRNLLVSFTELVERKSMFG